MESALLRVVGHDDQSRPEISAALEAVIRRYPRDLQSEAQKDAPRIVEHASWAQGCARVLDIGGGFEPFAPLLSMRGAEVTIVDTFEHEFFQREDLQALIAEFPMELVTMDATADSLPFESSSFDCITTFDSLEHWHHSPRRLFGELRRVAQPGALFILGVPNAVNARKRIAVLFGKTNWSRFEDWYEPDRFFGHVREPVVADLEKMADELGLRERAIVGRNWLGLRRGPLGQRVTAIVDKPLRLRPSLCANLYLLGRFA